MGGCGARAHLVRGARIRPGSPARHDAACRSPRLAVVAARDGAARRGRRDLGGLLRLLFLVHVRLEAAHTGSCLLARPGGAGGTGHGPADGMDAPGRPARRDGAAGAIRMEARLGRTRRSCGRTPHIWHDDGQPLHAPRRPSRQASPAACELARVAPVSPRGVKRRRRTTPRRIHVRHRNRMQLPDD